MLPAADPCRMRFGVEAEFALVAADGTIRDFATLPYRAAASIVDRLGDGDHPDLVRCDLGIKRGRRYVEGGERFDERGGLVECVPRASRPTPGRRRGFP